MRNLGMQVQEASRWGGPDKILQKWAQCSGCVLDCMGRVRLIGITSFVAC
jgi:hypothetical protein